MEEERRRKRKFNPRKVREHHFGESGGGVTTFVG